MTNQDEWELRHILFRWYNHIQSPFEVGLILLFHSKWMKSRWCIKEIARVDHFDLTLEGWDLWRSSWVNALVAVATIPTSEPSGPEKFGRSFGVFFFCFGRGPDLETRYGHIWDVFFLGGKKKVHEFSGNVCVFFLVLWKLIEDQLGVDVTTPWQQWFFGRLLDERDLQLHSGQVWQEAGSREG